MCLESSVVNEEEVGGEHAGRDSDQAGSDGEGDEESEENDEDAESEASPLAHWQVNALLDQREDAMTMSSVLRRVRVPPTTFSSDIILLIFYTRIHSPIPRRRRCSCTSRCWPAPWSTAASSRVCRKALGRRSISCICQPHDR